MLVAKILKNNYLRLMARNTSDTVQQYASIEADILADKDALVLALAKARAAARRQALIDHPEYDESNKPEPAKEETPETEEDLEHARAEARRQGEEDRARDRTKDQ